jgi:hypothetical protein
VVKEWPESPYKTAVIRAITHKLTILDLQEKASMKVTVLGGSSRDQVVVTCADQNGSENKSGRRQQLPGGHFAGTAYLLAMR